MGEYPSILTASYAPNDHTLVERALHFARKAHAGQKRKSGEDYIVHPLAVAETLVRLNLDGETIAAAILHDVLEDTTVSLAEIREEFGEVVAFLVESVSKFREIPYPSTREEFAENFRKMILATAKDIRVVLIKLADVLHNIRTIESLPQERRERYGREVLEIYAPIAGRLGIGWLKGELEDSAFPYIYRAEYAGVLERAGELIAKAWRRIEEFEPKVMITLQKEGVSPLRLDARVKHLYSLWKKLARYDDDLSKIHDLVALRIIVPDVPTCYKTLGILHKYWIPLPGRIKDYIATPKPNGYRSLHTTVFAEEGEITEFQIRTAEMHEEAELGIAAHWAYKEESRTVKKHLSWIRQIKDWGKAVGANELLEELRIDFFRDRIFVFTPKGDVIDLPEGATPVDFAYAVHSELGDRVALAKVNGKPVQLSMSLKMNDIVEIVTAKNKKPSRDWLGFVKTSKARGKIRDALRKEGVMK